MIDFFRDIFGRYTPLIILGVIAAIFVVMIIFGLNFG
jgi:hypothetical protein